MNVSKDILRQAFEEQNERELEHIPVSNVPENMHAMVLNTIKETQPAAKGTPARRQGRKLVYALIAAVVLVSLLTVTSVAVFSPFKLFEDLFHIHNFGEGSQVTYTEDEAEEGFINGTYSYVPNGYTLTTNETDEQSQWLVYTNKKGDELVSQTTLAEDSGSLINTEDTAVEEVTIGKRQGWYLKNDGYQEIQWVTGQYVNSVSVDNDKLSKAKLIKMAASRTRAP